MSDACRRALPRARDSIEAAQHALANYDPGLVAKAAQHALANYDPGLVAKAAQHVLASYDPGIVAEAMAAVSPDDIASFLEAADMEGVVQDGSEPEPTALLQPLVIAAVVTTVCVVLLADEMADALQMTGQAFLETADTGLMVRQLVRDLADEWPLLGTALLLLEAAGYWQLTKIGSDTED